ncbi:MAG TPA: hypothetical protein VFT45_14695 [Longimicrobium sp.]|nr:hypothetical protein [Longimicrobium sp.]
MRILIPALLLLAACSGSDSDEKTRSSDSTPAAMTKAADAIASPAEDADPPDFGDPRLFLSLDSLDWRPWETDAPADRAARLRQLGIRPVRADSIVEFDPSTGYDPNGERAQDFHFVDFSGDGVADVIYDGAWYVRNENGFGAMEGTHFKLYQVIGGRGVQVMDHHGTVQRIWKGAAGQPISFRTVHYGCCSDPMWAIEYFRPVRAGDTVRFERRHGVLGRAEMEIPTRFMAAPRRFTVANDGYLLRGSPTVQPTPAEANPEWYEWEGHGNVMAEYARGATGTAIAERTDDTGRVWWFVRMDGATPPRAAQIEGPVDDANRVLPIDRLGWMSSRFLTEQP